MEVVFNQEKALKRTLGDRDLLAELLDFTVSDIRTQIMHLNQALESDNGHLLKEEAHKLKGTAGAVGADRLFQASFALEQIAMDSDNMERGRALGRVEECAAEFLEHPAVGELQGSR